LRDSTESHAELRVVASFSDQVGGIE
jgi:hypothetical protein